MMQADKVLKILVVDDDEVDRMAIRRALGAARELKVKIEEVSNSKDAAEALANGKFDCVLLDYLLPGTDGLGVMHTARASGHSLPIIMLTGHGDERLAVKLLQAGASDYLPKEKISPELLSHCIRNATRVHQAEHEQSRVEKELQQSTEMISHILESISDAFFAVDINDQFSFANAPARTLLGEQVLIGKNVWEQLTNDSMAPLREHLEKTRVSDEPIHFEWLLNDQGCWFDAHIYPHKGGLSIYLHEITERKSAEEQLAYQANHDTLTGLPNRAMFMDRLAQALTRAPWHERHVAVLFCDLDRFKVINDSLGHSVGDKILKIVAERLLLCAREGDTVARLGGDEFVVVLADVAENDDVKRFSEKLIRILTRPYQVDDHELFITASIGASLFPRDGHEPGILLKNADTAMYQAKARGKNTFTVYSPNMSAEVRNRLSLESELRKALEHNEFELHYQPVLDINKQQIVAAEALIRWKHRTSGLLTPDKFLSVAEESGLILPIGEWVLHTAANQSMAWENTGLSPLRIAVNISNKQFHQANLPTIVDHTLRETGLPASRLELELTENIIMENVEETIQPLHKLREIGVRLSIDDFGTGYSSLAYLKQFPLNTIKIDRSFIVDITTDGNDAAITGAIIAIAQKMNMSVIAEGVETKQQLQFLRNQGCEEIQGYLLSPAIPADNFAEFIRNWQLKAGDKVAELDRLIPNFS